jgi:DNA polymerase-3 subunit delta'
MFGRPEDAQAERWLTENQLAAQAKWLPFFGNAPFEVATAAQSGRLKALEALVADLLKPLDPLAQATRWEALVKADSAMSMDELVTTVQKWLFDLGCLAVGAPARFIPHAALQQQAQHISLPALMRAQQQVGQLRAWANHPLNPRLFLEDLCVRAFKPLNP